MAVRGKRSFNLHCKVVRNFKYSFGNPPNSFKEFNILFLIYLGLTSRYTSFVGVNPNEDNKQLEGSYWMMMKSRDIPLQVPGERHERQYDVNVRGGGGKIKSAKLKSKSVAAKSAAYDSDIAESEPMAPTAPKPQTDDENLMKLVSVQSFDGSFRSFPAELLKATLNDVKQGM